MYKIPEDEPFDVRYARILAEGKELAKKITCKYCLDTKYFGHSPCPYCCSAQHTDWQDRQRFERITAPAKDTKPPKKSKKSEPWKDW